jgi:pilus assembly protein CpaC
MFSNIPGRMPIARSLGATLIVFGLVPFVRGQELTAPLPPTGLYQGPSALLTPPAAYQPATDTAVAPAASGAEPVVHKIQAPNERMEMTVNSSRVLSLDQNIPRAQVNNKDILELTPLSPNEIQVAAKKTGVTQINLWNEKGQIYTVDCVVYGDARELQELLRSQFPAANLKVRPMASSVLLTGFVDRPDMVTQIIQIAQDYYPKVIPDIRVGGVQQILLHVKVAEVSRTKARSLGFDFAKINGNSFIASSVSGLLSAASVGGTAAAQGAGDTVRFGVVDGNSAFFGFLEALRKEDVLKILSDPTLTTVSGRPAFFNSGGEFPILVPQSLGTVSIEYKKFGTQLDFVPIVLGNGNVRLEVRPRVSEIDPTRSITINGTTVPGLRVREADTGVEMKPGQTLAIAGLVQTRVESSNREIPWLGELPWVGAVFRSTSQIEEEVELLILVTPEVVAGLDPCETPQCLPGMHSDVPNDVQQYLKGYIEVPSKGPCGPGCGCGVRSFDGDGSVVPGAGSQRMEQVSPGAPAPASSGDSQSSSRSTSGMTTSNSGRNSMAPASGQNRYNPSGQQEPRSASRTNGTGNAPGFIGPVGYDVLN